MNTFKEPIHQLENPTTFENTVPQQDTSSQSAQEQKNMFSSCFYVRYHLNCMEQLCSLATLVQFQSSDHVTTNGKRHIWSVSLSRLYYVDSLSICVQLVYWTLKDYKSQVHPYRRRILTLSHRTRRALPSLDFRAHFTNFSRRCANNWK